MIKSKEENLLCIRLCQEPIMLLIVYEWLISVIPVQYLAEWSSHPNI